MVPRTIRSVRWPAAVLVAWLAAGCGGRPPEEAPEPVAAADPCLLPTGEPGEPRELVVAVVRPEDTSAVARRQPEPLVRLDCSGVARPAAAESWSADATRRSWTLVLARTALDVTAGAAAAEWRTRPGSATTLRQSGVVAVTPLDDRRLVVSLGRPFDSLPILFADPSLALVTDSLPHTGTRFLLRPVGADPRDALDAGVDILPSDDPDLLEYARTRSDVVVHPLPWGRTYVLVIPPEQGGFDDLIPPDSAAFRAGLARDAVRVEARAAEGPYWWEDAGTCPDSEPPSASAPGLRPPAHAWADPAARALAERLVALSSRPLRVIGGLHPRLPVPAVHSGQGVAYVVGIPRVALVPCREVVGWPAGSSVVPLVETRRSVVVRRGVPLLTVEFDGRLRPVETP
jgi:hypothetical protein